MPYTYYRPAVPEDELSAYFAAKLGLVRSFEDEPFPLRGDRWWVSHMFDTAEEYGYEAARLGIDESGELSLVTFEARKNLSTSEYFQAHIDLFGAVIDQLNEVPELTGILTYGDISVLVERPPGGQTLLDSKLADPEDWNADHHLDEVLARGTVTDLDRFP
ncbi:MAG TPA: hypothetical protein VFU12_20705 [Glycomyces sp.]|nr:hypothetical protein [Glycomyces sp.]